MSTSPETGLHVCLINDSFPPAIDGVANAVTNYAKIIARDYGEPTVVTPFYPHADDTAFHFYQISFGDTRSAGGGTQAGLIIVNI